MCRSLLINNPVELSSCYHPTARVGMEGKLNNYYLEMITKVNFNLQLDIYTLQWTVSILYLAAATVSNIQPQYVVLYLNEN